MKRARLAAWIAALLAAAAVALVVPTLFLKPYSVDHFYTRLFLQFAWRRPLLLSQLGVLEPLGLRFHNDQLNDLSVEFQVAEADWVVVVNFERGQPRYVGALAGRVTKADVERGDAVLFKDRRFTTLLVRPMVLLTAKRRGKP